MRKRILSAALALCMLLALLPALSIPALATPASYNVEDSIRLIDGGQESNIYFGTYPQSSDGEGGYSDDPIKWRVLAKNVDDAMLLLANQNLDAKPFHNFFESVTWETSTIRSWLNGYGSADGDSFIGSAFTDSEQDAIAETALSDSTNDKIYLLSKDEAEISDYGFTSQASRVTSNTAYTESMLGSDTGWWLRSNHSDDEVDYVHSDGHITSCNPDYACVSDRPAFRLDHDAVLFSTAADFDNSAAFAKTASYGGSDWKLTLLDGNTGFEASIADMPAAVGGRVTVNVASLGSGTGYTQISAMMISSGDVKAYGRIGAASTGEITFTVPVNLSEGEYTLRIFAEDVNGAYHTDYASNTVDISLSLTPPVFPFGTKVKLVDDSVWFVLVDEGSSAAQFTLVKDGFLDGAYSRSAVDAAISTYQETARTTFNDASLVARLPTETEIWAVQDSGRSFSDTDTQYWLPNSEENGYYQYARGGHFVRIRPDLVGDTAYAIRPVMTVLKSALLIFEPYITQQPETIDLLALAGDDAEFSVEAIGSNLTYQWQVKNGEAWTDIAGAEGPTLTVAADNENYALGKTFRCRLNSDWGEFIYSGEAQFVALDWQQYGGQFAQTGIDYTVSEDGNTVTIHTAAGLGWLAAQVNGGNDFAGIAVVLDHDLDLSGRTFIPIGTDDLWDQYPFCGHFDGGMHTVSGMEVQGYFYGGLFGLARGALIENLFITDGAVCGYIYVGALCGSGEETIIRNVGIESVSVSSRDTGAAYSLGGIVGYLQGGSDVTCVFNSYSRAELTGSAGDAGGIAGVAEGSSIANCYFAGTIAVDSPDIGGIAGYADSFEISDCFWQTDDGIPCAYYTNDESWSSTIEGNTGCTAVTAEQLKSSGTVAALNAWAAAENTAAGSFLYELWGVKSTLNEGYPIFKAVIPASPSVGFPSSSSHTITVTETSSPLFSGVQGTIKAEANMTNAFSNSVEVKVTDTEEDAAGFGVGIGNKVYPFDISLYIKGTNTKTQPKDGYAVTISLPVPEVLLNVMNQLSVVHKSNNRRVTRLASELKQISGVWYLVFKATEFSPYALVVNSRGAYEEKVGLPYYVDAHGTTTFIGFAAKGKYLAPSGVTVLVKENPKSFTDVGSHWAKDYIEFATEREIFLGTGNGAFSPDSGMTRGMFATVIGRLYERSYGEIEAMSTHAFTDCDYGDYYGKYVDWAAKNGILDGYGNGKFGPGDPVTREQMAAILYRFADFLGALPNHMDTVLNYPDSGSIANWAENAALYCQSTGIITGREGGNFVPRDTAKRAEVAAIIRRFVESVLA